MVSYVVGIAFNEERDRILLIEKNRPNWQRGYWNGPGGHIETGETPSVAMAREFREETGLLTAASDWEEFAVVVGAGFRVTFLRTVLELFYAYDSLTDEKVSPFYLDLLPPVIPNLQYLIKLALHADSSLSGTKLTLPVYFQEVAAA